MKTATQFPIIDSLIENILDHDPFAYRAVLAIAYQDGDTIRLHETHYKMDGDGEIVDYWEYLFAVEEQSLSEDDLSDWYPAQPSDNLDGIYPAVAWKVEKIIGEKSMTDAARTKLADARYQRHQEGLGHTNLVGRLRMSANR